MNMSSPPNPFETLWAMGYRRVVPIVPHDAELSERSSLHARLLKGKDARGKSPGIRWPDGKWSGYDFTAREATEADLARWRDMSPGVGIRTGSGLYAIDADTLDTTTANQIATLQKDMLGDLPRRIGRAPKALSPFRCSADLPYTLIEFGEPDAEGNFERVELLAEGKQFVAWGIHPKTLQPYHWTSRLVPFDELPIIEPERVAAFVAALQRLLPKAKKTQSGDSSVTVDQESLRGELSLVRKAVAALPVNNASFSTREAWRDVGYAIKASLPDHPAEALELFQEWSSGWEHPTKENEPDFVASEWHRYKPPFKIGAGWLCDRAEKVSGGAFTAAERWFEQPPGETESLFPFADGEEPTGASRAPVISATPYVRVPASAIPPRRSLYAGHYLRKFVSTTLAPSKVGKTSLLIAEALCMVSGKPLLGVEPTGQFRVWLWNGEDPYEELQRRIEATAQYHGLQDVDIGDRLFVDSGRQMPIVMARQDKSGTLIATPTREAYIRTALENRIDVGVLDPFISSHQVSENDNVAIDTVTKTFGYIADVCNMGVELPHHVRKLNGGEITVEDGRGASALIATSRSARALARMTKVEGAKLGLSHVARKLFRFADTSSNLYLPTEGESEQWMELHSVNLGNGEGDGVLDAMMNGDSVGVVRRFDMPAESARRVEEMAGMVDGVGMSAEARALETLADGQWRRDVRAGEAWAGRPIMRALGLDIDDKDSVAQAKTILSAWIKAGKISEFDRMDQHRKPRTYIQVTDK